MNTRNEISLSVVVAFWLSLTALIMPASSWADRGKNTTCGDFCYRIDRGPPHVANGGTELEIMKLNPRCQCTPNYMPDSCIAARITVFINADGTIGFRGDAGDLFNPKVYGTILKCLPLNGRWNEWKDAFDKVTDVERLKLFKKFKLERWVKCGITGVKKGSRVVKRFLGPFGVLLTVVTFADDAQAHGVCGAVARNTPGLDVVIQGNETLDEVFSIIGKMTEDNINCDVNISHLVAGALIGPISNNGTAGTGRKGCEDFDEDKVADCYTSLYNGLQFGIYKGINNWIRAGGTCFNIDWTTIINKNGRPSQYWIQNIQPKIDKFWSCINNATYRGLACADPNMCSNGSCNCADGMCLACQAEKPCCTPQCAGRSCGPDGCGGSCGTCPNGTCNQYGKCQANCTPQCTGKQCGSDGCGGSCGTCPNGTCNQYGQCQANCTPQCTGKQCGSDGCGGSCGTCPNGTCNQYGKCQANCTPQCAGKQCGSDGCGGSCGTCQNGTCNQYGQCQANCTPQCAGKQCGSDGCGGSCGTCPNGTCNQYGKCQDVMSCITSGDACVIGQAPCCSNKCINGKCA